MNARLQQEHDVQLAVWEGLAGQWVGDDREIDAMIEDIYQARTEGREVSLAPSGSHAPAWEQVATLQRRGGLRAAGAAGRHGAHLHAGAHSHAGAWE